MTRLSTKLWGSTAGALGVALTTLAAGSAHAQCSTCFTPTVAYSPVVQPVAVAQPVAVSTSWYPGRQLDLWRMNRLARHTVAMPVVAAAPVATTAYMPVTSSCSTCVQPAATTFVAAYAPAVSSCSSCAQTSYTPVVASYAPTTVYRPAVLTPVVTESACSACSACTTVAPCSSCASAAPIIEQTSYVEPNTGCSSCASVAAAPTTTVTEMPAAPSQGSIVTTPGAAVPDVASPNNPPAPELKTDELTPEAAGSTYDANRPEDATKESPAEEGATPGPVADEPEADPAAFEAPRLLNPNNDLRANRPTVDVHHAVYRQASVAKPVSTAARPVVAKTQAEMDAAAWHSAPRSR